MGKLYHDVVENNLRCSIECMSAILADLTSEPVGAIGDNAFVTKDKVDIERTQKIRNIAESLRIIHQIAIELRY